MVQLNTPLSGLSLLTHFTQATPLKSKKYEYSVKEVHNPPRKWTRVGSAPGSTILNLHIGLHMPRWNELEKHLLESKFVQ
jgi:hypothetical protein